MRPLSRLGMMRFKKRVVASKTRPGVLPRGVRMRRFPGAAGGAQDLEHVGEGASISRLGDEDGAAHQED